MLTNNTLKFDLAIVGAGVAGISAAYGASLLGLSVLVIEKYGFFGGLASSAWVGTICGSYLKGDNTFKTGVGRFPTQFVKAVTQHGCCQPVQLENGLAFLPTKPIVIDEVARQFLRRPEITLMTHSVLCEAKLEDDRIHTLKVLAYNRILEIKVNAIVDTSGEAVVSSLAGLPTQQIIESQACSLSVVISNAIYIENETALSREISLVIKRELPSIAASISPGSAAGQNFVLKITKGVTPKSAKEVIEEELDLRELAKRVFSLIKSNISVLEGAEIRELTPQLGVRAGILPVGKEILTRAHVIEGGSCDEGIANGCWPIEKWMPNGSVQLTHLEKPFYQIPAATLESANCENLWFAGRSFGAESDAIASARVIGTALGTGYAAGQLAASYCLRIKREQAIDVLREQQQLKY